MPKPVRKPYESFENSWMISLRAFSRSLPGLYFPWLTKHLWCRNALVRFSEETLRKRRSCVAATTKIGTRTRRFDTEDEVYIVFWICFFILFSKGVFLYRLGVESIMFT